MNTLARTNRDVYDLLNKRLYCWDVTQPQSRSLRWGIEKGVQGTIRRAVDVAQKLEFNPIPESFHFALQGLILAAGEGHSAVVESFLARDNLNPIYMEYALGYAAFQASQVYFASRHVDVMKLLLDRPDVNPNSTGYAGKTALMLGLYSPDVVKLLLDQEGIDVSSRTTAFFSAAHHNYVESAKLLLERDNINVNIPDNGMDRWTPLHWACFHGSLKMVDLLLERDDIDPNVKDVNWYSPLNIACRFSYRMRHSNIPIIRSLLSHRDTDPNSLDRNGVSILVHFVMRRQHWMSRRTAIEIKSLLYAAGARRLSRRQELIAFLARQFPRLAIMLWRTV
ncbi:Ankyrin repeat-containing domain protein [Elaphomyces granulatus]